MEEGRGQEDAGAQTGLPQMSLEPQNLRKGRAKEWALFWLILRSTRWDHPEAAPSPPGVRKGMVPARFHTASLSRT